MPDAAVGTGWSTSPGCCWDYVQHQKKRQGCRLLKQPMDTLWCCPVSYSRLHVHLSRCQRRWSSQHGEAGQRSREVARGGGPGGFLRVRLYVLVGAVTGPLDAMYRGPYRVLIKERKKLLLEVGATWQWVSVDRLKPHTAAVAPAVVQPPPRGGPSKS